MFLNPGIPFAPFNLSSAFNDRSSGLRWTAPFDNGRAVLWYTVYSRYIHMFALLLYLFTICRHTATNKLVYESNVSATSRNAMLYNMLNGVNYILSVYANNILGRGPPNFVHVVPAGVPFPTPLVHAVAGDTNANLTWYISDRNGRDVLWYHIHVYPNDTTTVRRYPVLCYRDGVLF